MKKLILIALAVMIVSPAFAAITLKSVEEEIPVNKIYTKEIIKTYKDAVTGEDRNVIIGTRDLTIDSIDSQIESLNEEIARMEEQVKELEADKAAALAIK